MIATCTPVVIGALESVNFGLNIIANYSWWATVAKTKLNKALSIEQWFAHWGISAEFYTYIASYCFNRIEQLAIWLYKA